MLNTIIIVSESRPGVIWRINVDALNLPCEFLFQSFQCKQIVAKNESIIEIVGGGNTMDCVIRVSRTFEQYPRFKLRPIFFADPLCRGCSWSGPTLVAMTISKVRRTDIAHAATIPNAAFLSMADSEL